MTASATLAPAPEPAWWTLYSRLAEGAAALGRPVAHLPALVPVSIGHPTDTTEPARHVWVRYRDPDGTTYGVATLVQPDRMVRTPGDTEGVALAVAATLRHAGHARGVFDPYDPGPPQAHGPLRIDGLAYASETCAAAPGVTVRAARMPDGSVIAAWGPDTLLDRDIALTR
jgi:hypothetical protein